MKRLLVTLIVSLNFTFSYSQLHTGSFANENLADSLLRQIQQTTNDTSRVDLLNSLGDYYAFNRHDSSIFYLSQSIELAEKINYLYGSYSGYTKLAFVLNTASNYGKALDLALKSLKIAEKLKDNREENMAESYDIMGIINRRMDNDSTAIDQSHQSIQLFNEAHLVREKMNFSPYITIALIYLKWGSWDSAYFYAKKGYDISMYYPVRARAQQSVTSTVMANVFEKTGKIQLAHEFYLRGIEIDKKYGAPLLRVRIFNNFARFFKNTGQMDSCIYYANMAFQQCRNHQFGEQATDAASLVAQAYEIIGKPDSALKYTRIIMAAKDTIFNQAKLMQIQLLNFDEGQRQKDIQREINTGQERYRNQVRYYILIATAGIFLLLSVLLYRNNRTKQIANKTLESQKMEIDQQRTKAESTLLELKSTQAQLIQSEKMASLGELTAGIAHEIQNPLNFVNNFSEINKEMIDEATEEINKGNISEVKNILIDIKDNEGKINHHGRRADAIVKGMLQHSRSSAGTREPTDINVLSDEYLRLAYHGLRAKDSSFNAIMKTDFDESIGKINTIPQDMGRVLLNLYNNAFYAVNERKRLCESGYEPTVSVSTKKSGNKVLISVKDNGDGIPQKTIDKIFHPFFTTKPPGQGTGLGLSISYDIIKAYGGELKVESKDGEGAEFIILIPVVT
jgi:two-component system, NtrC family, sensor kinase